MYTGITGSILVSNGVEKPDSIFDNTVSESTECISPLRVHASNNLEKLTKMIGCAIFTLEEEMGYSVVLDLKEGWPVSILFILKYDTYDTSKKFLFSHQSCFWKCQDELVNTNFDGVWVVINVDSPEVGLMEN